MSKYIFSFGDKKTKKILNSRNILGGKGANLLKWLDWVYQFHQDLLFQQKCVKIFYKNKKKLTPKIM